jgi:hypothetical protein
MSLACSTLSNGTLSPQEIFERSAPSVVRIEVELDGGATLGTGFAIGPSQIATNLHVIAAARRAFVRLQDGRRAGIVSVVAADPENDLAILEIDGRGLRPLPLGDSDALPPGARIYAIGNPFGLDYTITEGLFSARRRVDPASPNEFLQISVDLSPGSSGGPLLSERGEVIGVATQTVVRQRLGLGVPSNTLRRLRGNATGPGEDLSTFVERLAARYGRRGGEERRREVPSYTLEVIETCTTDDIALVRDQLAQAIRAGVPLYNSGDPEACFRVYEGAALRLTRDLPVRCEGSRTALETGLERADGLESYDDKAWAMRDAFDGLLDVIGRRLVR